MNRRQQARVCFVAPNAYPLFDPACGTYFGGAEVQISYLAKALAGMGAQVTAIVDDVGQPADCTIDGVRLLSMKFNTSFKARLDLQRLLSASGASVMIQRGMGSVTKEVAWYRLWHRVKFVYMMASDIDADPQWEAAWGYGVPRFFRWAMRRADAIVAQKPAQQAALMTHYRLPSVVLPSVQPILETQAPRDIDVLWVSNIHPIKRPLLCGEIAERLTTYRFVMIARPFEGELTQALAKYVERLPNLTHRPGMRFHQAAEHYARARVFLCTSSSEGFPNTFLQSMAAGTPIVSMTVDPNDLLARHGCGILSGDDLEAAAQAIRTLLEDSPRWDACSHAGRDYVRNHHDVETVCRRLLELCQ